MTNNLKVERTLTAENRVSDERLAQLIANAAGATEETWWLDDVADALTELQSLRLQSLSTQQTMGEPVAWMHPTAGCARTKYHSVLVHCRKDGPKPIPLYGLHFNQESGE